MATGTDLVGSSMISINLSYKNVVHDSIRSDMLAVSESQAWTFGDGTNEIETVWHDTRSTDNTGESLIINTGATGNGGMVDAFGNTITIGVLKMLYIKNTHATLSLVIGAVANGINLIGGTTDSILIGPGASIFWQDPVGMTLGDEDIIKIACSTAATVTYSIAMAGEDL